MRILVDEQGNTVAYLYKKAIVDKSLSKVIGIILGNSVFANTNQPVGRVFNDALRNDKGEIIAKLAPDHHAENHLNTVNIRNGAWEILVQIKDHVSAWLPDKKSWSKENVETFLQRKSGSLAI